MFLGNLKEGRGGIRYRATASAHAEGRTVILVTGIFVVVLGVCFVQLYRCVERDHGLLVLTGDECHTEEVHHEEKH